MLAELAPNMTHTLSAPVGRNAKNLSTDEELVRDLLTQVGFEPARKPMPVSFRDPSCLPFGMKTPAFNFDVDLVTKIEAFQRLPWRGREQDIPGVVTPYGPTMQRLVALTSGFQLVGPIEKTTLSFYNPMQSFGYNIRYEGDAPKGGLPFHVLLYVGDGGADCNTLPANPGCMDITERDPHAVINYQNFDQLLTCIHRKKLWSSPAIKTAWATILVTNCGKVISASNSVEFERPVPPWDGGVGATMLNHTAQLEELNYTAGNLFIPRGAPRSYSIDGAYYFATEREAGEQRLVTKDIYRGFNCLFFVGAVYKIGTATGWLGDDGSALAQHLGEGLEQTFDTAEEVKNFFRIKNAAGQVTGYKPGYYLVWGEHALLVVDGTMHEFLWYNQGDDSAAGTAMTYGRRAGYNHRSIELLAGNQQRHVKKLRDP